MAVRPDSVVHLDARVSSMFTKEVHRGRLEGPRNVTVLEFPVTVSGNDLSCTIISPSRETRMSRRVEIVGGIQTKFQMAGGNSTVQVCFPTHVSSAAMPFNSMLTSATVLINNSSLTTPMQTSVDLSLAQLASVERRKGLGVALSAPARGATSNVEQTIVGGIFSTDLPEYDAPYSQCAPSAWSFTSGTYATGNFTGTLSVQEPLMIQPFTVYDEDDTFTNIDRIGLSLTVGNVTTPRFCPLRFAEYVGTSQVTVSNFGVTDFSKLRVRCTFYTPFPEPSVAGIYPYMKLRVHDLPVKATLYARPSTPNLPYVLTATSGQIQFPICPDFVAIYAVPTYRSTAATTYNIAASALQQVPAMAPVSRVSIKWNNTASLLETATQQSLWKMSYANGVCVPWYVGQGGTAGPTRQVAATVGAPLLLRVGTDIPVPTGVSAGSPGDFRLEVNVELAHFLKDQEDPVTGDISDGYRLVVVGITEAYLRLNPGSTSELLETVVPPAEVASVEDVQSAPVKRRRAFL